MPAPGDNPSLEDVLRETIATHTAAIETAIPARITAYDQVQQRASCKPLIKGVRLNADTGAREFYELPVIPGVPVLFPQGGGFSITWPLVVGDRVMLVFQSRDIAGWLSNDNNVNEPRDPRRHDLNDAVAIAGLSSFANALGSDSVDSTAMVVKGNPILLGSSAATKFITLANDLLVRLNDIETKYNGHTHVYIPGTLAVAPTAAPVPTIPLSVLTDIASDKVKSE